ncbi:MAG: hypothetical protein JNL84_10030 [Candidatus Accumulibacter sp.]|nr:hypothetical protein [Accumulibacter sp.]
MPHESAPIGRAAASTINPLIGSFTEDSLSNLSRMVCDLGYLLSQVDNPPEGTEPCFGSLYLLCGVISAALDYERKNPHLAGENRGADNLKAGGLQP